jgi:hypothetical protein
MQTELVHSDASKFLQVVWNVCALAFLTTLIFNVSPAFGLILALYLICAWLVGLYAWTKLYEAADKKKDGSTATPK